MPRFGRFNSENIDGGPNPFADIFRQMTGIFGNQSAAGAGAAQQEASRGGGGED